MKYNFLKVDAFQTQSWNNPSSAYPEGVHNGIDIAVSIALASPTLYSPIDGKVIFARWDISAKNPNGSKGYGQRVVIRGRDPFNPERFVDIGFAHNGQLVYDGDPYDCDGLLVKEGQEVKAGDPISVMGSTGYSTGRHTHASARPVKEDGTIIYLPGNVGGYIDPLKYLTREIIMSNVKIVRKEGSPELAILLPIPNPEALKGYGMNFGKDIPLKADGSVDFDRLKIEGSYKLV